MANTSAIFKGSRTKLLTKDGLSLEAGQSVKVVDGAAAGAVMVSDALGVVTLGAVPAITALTGEVTGYWPRIYGDDCDELCCDRQGSHGSDCCRWGVGRWRYSSWGVR
jgi:hypothetical protein